MEQKKIIESVCRKICSIVNEDEKWKFIDCNGNNLEWPDNGNKFPGTMKTHYYKEYYKDKDNMQYPTVWILVCVDKYGKENIIQVGRTIDIVSAMNEIRENVKSIYGIKEKKSKKDKKYEALKNKTCNELVFFEVNINAYTSGDDDDFKKMYREVPKERTFALAYYFLRAAYVEGKIGFVSRKECEESMYHPSSLDGYFYSYYENKSK